MLHASFCGKIEKMKNKITSYFVGKIWAKGKT